MPARRGQSAHGAPPQFQANSIPSLLRSTTWLLPWLLQSSLHLGNAQAGATGTCLIQVARGPLVFKPGATPSSSHEAAPPAAALLERSSRGGGAAVGAGAGQHSTRHAAKAKDLPHGWFGNFAKSESTFDHDGVGDSDDFPERAAAKVSEYGNSVNMAAQEAPFYAESEGLPSEWFEESVSGGPHAAWRTQFPQVEAFRGEGMKTVPWLPDHGGRQRMTYIPSAATSLARAFDATKRKDAPWFDNEISNFDDFGRNWPPSERSDRFYWDWEEKSWSVPLQCKDPGCVANATLKTFDSKALLHARCRLFIGVHMTDYDDEYSREYVEWLIVNDHRVHSRCDPMGKGCNATIADKDRGLHPCVSEYPLDNLLAEGTELKIAGKISDMVDECPVNNNLLSGEAKVTCLVKPRPPPTSPPPPVRPQPEDMPACSNSALLQCAEAGCVANTTLTVCRNPEQGQRCLLSARVWQTDYDGDHGSVELIEFVKVNDRNVSTNVKPGRNPCKEVYEGKPPSKQSLAEQKGLEVASAIGSDGRYRGIGLDDASAGLLADVPDDVTTPAENCRRRVLGRPQASSFFTGAKEVYYNHEEQPTVRPVISHLRADPDEMKEIVTGEDVTEDVLKSRQISIDGKISRMVDECAKDGYLLNMEVSVECK